MKNFLIFLLFLPMKQYAQDTIPHSQLKEQTKMATSSGEYKYLYEGELYTGIAETSYEDGYIVRTNYKEGKKHGKDVSFINGTKVSEMTYSEGIPVGEIRNWYSNGNLSSVGKGAEILKENVRIVDTELSKKYLSDTLALSELVSDDYFYDGEWKFYHNNGQLEMAGSYKPVGFIEVSTSEDLDSSGIISVEITQPRGAKEGWWKLYDENGVFLKMEYYENDELLEEKWR